MPTNYWTGATDADWNTAGNWSIAVPVDGEDVIIDGRDTTAVDITTVASQGAIDLASLHIMSSFANNIGTAAAPLEIEVSGTLLIEGSGSYYIQSGSATLGTNGSIDRLIMNTSGNVYLSSFANDGANTTDFTKVIVNSGTLTVYGKAEAVATSGAEAGTVIGTLVLAPTFGRSGGVTVTIGEQCFKANGNVYTNIIMQGGSLTTHSAMLTVDQFGGTLTQGSTAYTMIADDDGTTTLNLYGGTFKWQPSVMAGGVRTTASTSPQISTANFYGGTFDASGMLETLTSAPTLVQLWQHAGSTVNLDNGYANFSVSTFKKYGGTLLTSAGQALSLT